jgi:hypothetical protein
MICEPKCSDLKTTYKETPNGNVVLNHQYKRNTLAQTLTSSTGAITFNKIKVEIGSELFHASTANILTPLRIQTAGGGIAGKKMWFTPDYCQSIPHPKFTGGINAPTAYILYKYEVITAPLNLIVIDQNKYPLEGSSQSSQYLDDLQWAMSGNPNVDASIDSFCSWAGRKAIDGWRQTKDQNEIMLCDGGGGFQKLKEKTTYPTKFIQETFRDQGGKGAGINKCTGIFGVSDYQINFAGKAEKIRLTSDCQGTYSCACQDI